MADCGEDSGNGMWYKADAIVGLSDGQPVATWADQSGHGRDLIQNTLANQFLYRTNVIGTMPALQAPDAARFMTIPAYTQLRPGAPTGGYVMYFVCNYTPSGKQMFLLSTQSAFGGLTCDASETDNNLGIFQSHVSFAEGPAAVGGWQVLAYVYDWVNAQLRIYRNGVKIYTQSTGGGVGNDSDSVWTVGAAAGVNGLIGWITEVQIYTGTAHTDRQVNSFSECLLNRWGFPATAPSATPAVTTTNRSLWREYTGEKNSDVIPDTQVDVYIQAGLEALNRRIRYHYTDDSSTVVFAAGVQEYALPGDCIEVIFVEWNGRLLEKRSIEDWRVRGEDWRRARAGEPVEWAMYGNKLVLNCPPTAEAVAAAASPTIRYVSTPPAVAVSGFDQLMTQDQRIPVYHGVAEYSLAYPSSAAVVDRGQNFMKKFDDEARGVAADYTQRLLSGAGQAK